MIEEKQAVRIMLTGKDKWTLIVPDAFVGQFVIHKRITDGKAIGDGFTVTHKQSGAAVWTVASEEEARRVADWLTADKVFPENGEVMVWLATMSVLERSKLVERLQNIAPRYRTPWSAT